MEVKLKNSTSHIKSSKTTANAISRFLKNDLSAWFIILPSLFLLFVIILGPVLNGFVLSFFDMKGFQPVKFAGLKHYTHVLTDTLFLKTLLNTCTYVFWSIIIGYMPPIIIAIILNEIIHFKSFFKFAVYFPVIVPSVAAALIWYFLYQPGDGGVLNLIFHYFGLPASQWLQNSKMTIPYIVVAMTWRGFGGSTIMYLASLQGVNQELYEAATMDGASILSKVKNITLPQISGVMLLLFVRQIIGVFQVMVEPMTMTGGGPNNASLTLCLQGYYYAFTYFQPDNALALGVITFLILMIATLFYFKLNKKVNEA